MLGAVQIDVACQFVLLLGQSAPNAGQVEDDVDIAVEGGSCRGRIGDAAGAQARTLCLQVGRQVEIHHVLPLPVAPVHAAQRGVQHRSRRRRVQDAVSGVEPIRLPCARVTTMYETRFMHKIDCDAQLQYAGMFVKER